jgi:uncharacterized protein YgiB involved in biofilm formation
MKKSRMIPIFLLGASAFALAACDDPVDVSVFKDKEACYSAAERTADLSFENCDTAFDAAQREHQMSAPRYESREICEEEHGVGNCGTDTYANNAGGGSSFMPFFMGYMVGNMMNNGSSSTYGRTVYPAKSGGYYTNSGQKFSALNTTARVSPSKVTSKPSVTLGKAPMTKATVSSRGGFGGGARAGG